ncbi:MAG: hypothetical protein M2R45_02321 [Verrucomicrobia subdivision 3 bacterium]|nr:hypothetical protein [Limisphaerales bacterium]MCS1414700.1 hypothetical protein [Limisphaerales bacterium]
MLPRIAVGFGLAIADRPDPRRCCANGCERNAPAHEFDADSQTAAAAVFYSPLSSFIPVTLILLLIRLN